MIKLGVEVIAQVGHYVLLLLLLLGVCLLGKRISAYLLQQVLVIIPKPPGVVLVMPQLCLYNLGEAFVDVLFLSLFLLVHW
jgi:hypothetical protein